MDEATVSQAGEGAPPASLKDSADQLLDFGDRLVMPGLIDVHTFFMGWALSQIGLDLASCADEDACVGVIEAHVEAHPEEECVIAVGYHPSNAAGFDAVLDEKFSGRRVVVFEEGMEALHATAAATDAYDLDPERCYPEGYWKLLGVGMGRDADLVSAFDRYQELMHSHGVTSVKEMVFDDGYGFVKFLVSRASEDALTLRVAVASQPVGYAPNLEWGNWCRQNLTGAHLEWWGYNAMTDGSISTSEADLLEPYEAGAAGERGPRPDYKALREAVVAADAQGDGYSLHAQGDHAVRECINIFEHCKRAEGKLISRQAITDLEMSTREDHVRMAKLGIVAEVYPQVPSLREPQEAIGLAKRQVGSRARQYWDRAGMAKAGVTIACATDFPLLTPSLPESAKYAVVLPQQLDKAPYLAENALTIEQLMQAWTNGGAIDLGKQGEVGALEVGAQADIAVFELDQSAGSLADAVAGGHLVTTLVAGQQVWPRILN